MLRNYNLENKFVSDGIHNSESQTSTSVPPPPRSLPISFYLHTVLNYRQFSFVLFNFIVSPFPTGPPNTRSPYETRSSRYEKGLLVLSAGMKLT